ncbi:hypothetical protein HPB51_013887 [Rhipicephalus microplus]|uniref:Zasp-like motif domain-containing protein n=1 Tax=Rhipicephalus microplus TaxID=6941 RepID=A0A9J6EHG2_RHIMP|nr:hypothetical protein HPB51_013887 [Rhipicephalus microplus]
MGLEGNEAADATAGVLSHRAFPLTYPDEDDLEFNPVYSLRKIVDYYELDHSLYPRPCKGLSKAEERLLLRLFTNNMLCPAALKHFDPAFSGSCSYCGEKSSDIYHMTWACPCNPAVPRIFNPTQEKWQVTLLGCSNLQTQKACLTSQDSSRRQLGPVLGIPTYSLGEAFCSGTRSSLVAVVVMCNKYNILTSKVVPDGCSRTRPFVENSIRVVYAVAAARTHRLQTVWEPLHRFSIISEGPVNLERRQQTGRTLTKEGRLLRILAAAQEKQCKRRGLPTWQAMGSGQNLLEKRGRGKVGKERRVRLPSLSSPRSSRAGAQGSDTKKATRQEESNERSWKAAPPTGLTRGSPSVPQLLTHQVVVASPLKYRFSGLRKARQDVRASAGEPSTVKAVVHNQYNSPLQLYSQEKVAETLAYHAQAITAEDGVNNIQPVGLPQNLVRSAVLQALSEDDIGGNPYRTANGTTAVQRTTAPPTPPPKPRPPSYSGGPPQPERPYSSSGHHVTFSNPGTPGTPPIQQHHTYIPPPPPLHTYQQPSYQQFSYQQPAYEQQPVYHQQPASYPVQHARQSSYEEVDQRQQQIREAELRQRQYEEERLQQAQYEEGRFRQPPQDFRRVEFEAEQRRLREEEERRRRVIQEEESKRRQEEESSVRWTPKTGFSPQLTRQSSQGAKQFVWPPPKSGVANGDDGGFPYRPPSRSAVNAWHPPQSPTSGSRTPPFARSPSLGRRTRDIAWPPPQPEASPKFVPRPVSRSGLHRPDEFIQQNASCGVPPTYRPPPNSSQYL